MNIGSTAPTPPTCRNSSSTGTRNTTGAVAQERAINAYSHFRTTVEDVPIHFIHERGKGPNPMPLILSHGWPWTFWDLHKVIRPLTDPAAFGGDPKDAFDVVVPSLPGYGFSTPLRTRGINFWRTADLLGEADGGARLSAQFSGGLAVTGGRW